MSEPDSLSYIDIFVSDGGSWVSWLVKKLTKSRWSHTGFIVNGQIIDSDITGVAKRKYYLTRDNSEIIRLKLTPIGRQLVLRKINTLLGSGYDYLLIFSLFYHLLRGRRHHENIRDLDGYFTCSEFVATCCQEVQSFGPCPPDSITPQDIWDWAKHNGAILCMEQSR